MLKLPGSSALSAFRIARLLARLRALEPAVSAVQAQFPSPLLPPSAMDPGPKKT